MATGRPGRQLARHSFAATDAPEVVRADSETATLAWIATLLLPGVGTTSEIGSALAPGVIRVATHCTGADVAIEHLTYHRARGVRSWTARRT